MLTEDELSKLINYGLEKGADFIDIRIEDYVEISITIRDYIVDEVSSTIMTGAGIRVLYNGGLGFASTNNLSWDNMVKTLESALKIAKLLSSKTNVKLTILPARHDIVQSKLEEDPRSVSPEQKINDLLKLSKEVLSRNEAIKTITTRYKDITGRTIYVSSEDRFIEQHYNYTWLYSWVTGRENDVVASARTELGTRKGYVIFNKYPQEEIADTLVKRVLNQLKAVTPKGGLYPAILAPEVVGVFAHEAFGHLAEADLTVSGSILADKLGKKIVSELVTIVDDPTIPDAYGTFKYDDEGVETRPVKIVEDGVLKELMVDRKFSAMLNMKPTGNARAEDYNVPPLIRMRTTYIAPRDMSLEELLEDIKYGYYLVSFRGGQANLDGTFQVGIQEAYEIVNGEIGRPVRNMSISGNTIDTLKYVSGVGKDFQYFYGRCGKGQTAYVSDGGPHIRVDKILIGGAK